MSLVRGRSGPRLAVLAAFLGLVLVGCLPTGVTEQSRAVNDLWNIFLVPAIAVAAVVWGLTTFAIVRFRRPRTTSPESPPQIAGNVRLEVVWTVIPVIIVAVLFVLTLAAVGRIQQRTEGGIVVDVSAFRWQWQFDYPAEGVRVVGLPDVPAEMVVPVGEPIHVTLTSPDVIHSFYVPAFLFKRDAIPGRPNQFEFTVEREGSYGGQCAEFCGINHDRMELTVRAVSRSAYQDWVAARLAEATTAP